MLWFLNSIYVSLLLLLFLYAKKRERLSESDKRPFYFKDMHATFLHAYVIRECKPVVVTAFAVLAVCHACDMLLIFCCRHWRCRCRCRFSFFAAINFFFAVVELETKN